MTPKVKSSIFKNHQSTFKCGNNVHAFHKFAPLYIYLEIKKRATSTLKILHNYENIHFTEMGYK